MERSNIVALSASDLEDGYDQQLRRLRERVDPAYVHLDLDVLDPGVGDATQYAAPGGLSSRELQVVLDTVRRSFAVRALALTSYDPRADVDGGVAAAALDAVIAFAVGVG